ncbi:MAG: cytochrome c biogenesis protein CcsA [Chloroflexi bacterium]|nr:cytochrome c biogenesis protein CcsA [Chloroflexota bacterium]
MDKNHALKTGLLGLTFVLFMAALYLVFIYVPTEREMGVIQRNFYLMVPMGWLAILAFLVIFVCSILYLKSRSRSWDVIALSSAELGVLFTSLALIVGSIWARPVWGVWWTWEPRLTATLVLWLIYLAYFMVRAFAAEESRGAAFAAVVGIVGFIDVPIIGMSTTLWRGMHPPMIIFQGGIDPAMLLTLIVSIIAFTALYCLLLVQRVSMRNDEIEIARLKKTYS